jgi:hypothetical protein
MHSCLQSFSCLATVNNQVSLFVKNFPPKSSYQFCKIVQIIWDNTLEAIVEVFQGIAAHASRLHQTIKAYQ